MDAAVLAAANNKMYFFKVNTIKMYIVNMCIAYLVFQLFTLRVTTTGDLNLGRNLMWLASTPRL